MRVLFLTLAAAWTGEDFAQLAVGPGGEINLRSTGEGSALELGSAPAPAEPISLVESVFPAASKVGKEVRKAVQMTMHHEVKTGASAAHTASEATAWSHLWICLGVIFGQIFLVAFLAWMLKPDAVAEPKKAAGPKPQGDLVELLFAMCAWIGSGMMLTLFNKWMFLEQGGNFPFVVFISGWHQFVVLVVCTVVRFTPLGTRVMPAAAEHGATAGLSASAVVRTVFPPAVCFAGSLILGNQSVFYLSVSFTQMLRSAKPAGVFLVSCAIGLESWSSTRAWLILFVFLGAVACSMQEIQFNLVGFIYQMTSFATDITRVIMLKVLVSQPGLDPYSAMAVFAPVCLLALGLPFYLLEWHQIAFAQFWTLKWVLLANGAIAVALNAATVKLMSLAPPTIFALTGTVNYLMTACISIWFFSTPTTLAQMTSFAVVLTAVTLYNYHQQTGKLPNHCVGKTELTHTD